MLITCFFLWGCFNIGNYISSIVQANLIINSIDIQEAIKKGLYAFSLGISLGMLSHIILDLLTKDGVAIFAPIIDKRLKFPVQIRTNGYAEKIICMIMTILIPIVGYIILFPYVIAIIQ